MYSTCLFCASPLRRNDVIECWPVGRRLAWDAGRGRLWVICHRCARWNLSPLEERWEAIEELERRFAATPTRHSTGEIALARTRDGIDLIRVGRAPRAEFAAWRFTEVFRARYRRANLIGGASILITGGLWLAGSSVAVLSGGSGGLALMLGIHSLRLRQERAPLGTLVDDAGAARRVRFGDLRDTSLRPREGGSWELRLRTSRETFRLGPEQARAVAPRLLAAYNGEGARSAVVASAVAELERVGTADRYFAHAAGLLQGRRIAPQVEHERYDLVHLPEHARLALEMAANEETERLMLEGELRLLHAAWREAEEIAAIADRLALPASVERALTALRRPGGGR